MTEVELLTKKIEELRKINEYYHDWCSEMMSELWFIQDDLEMKYNIRLPDSVRKDIKRITENFRFKYEEETIKWIK